MLTILCRVAKAFVNSKNIIKYSKSSYFVLNVVFHSSLAFILKKLKTSLKFNLMNHFALFNLLFKFASKESEYLFFYVIALTFLKSTHNFKSLDFFETNMINCFVLNLKYRIYSLVKLWSMYCRSTFDCSSFNS